MIFSKKAYLLFFWLCLTLSLSGCGADSKGGVIGSIRDSVRKLSGTTHYGYVGGQRYEATVTSGDVSSGAALESAMPPAEAASLAAEALQVIKIPSWKFRVCSINLMSYNEENSYYYLVSYCQKTQRMSVGFRVPVLLSGEVIWPRISED